MLKRLLLGLVVIGALGGALAISRSQGPVVPVKDLVATVESRNPWTNLKLNNDPDEFRFAIVSDRTGGHRANIFAQAVEQLNLLQPEFVLSVGDLIEGYTEKQERINNEWKEFQGFVSKLQMPFFYVPGNHDLTNKAMLGTWKEKFGRDYYHFVYRGVLFLILNSEDPPGKGGIGEEQQAWVAQTLAQTKDVRWTIVSLHKPLWEYTGAGPLDKNGFGEVEKMLNGRKYTVFAGHIHRFQKWVRQGMNYYQLATTGGASRMRGLPYGEVDQIAWVTMKKDGPIIANVLLDGIYSDELKKPLAEEAGILEVNRKPCFPTNGEVVLDGCPLAGCRVVFFYLDPETKKKIEAGDALVQGDGTFTLTTYKANDGAPAGEYAVCIQKNPGYPPEGVRVLPVAIPERYTKVDTTPLKATVTRGDNHFVFELKP
jgi:hypothetical protein